MATKKLTHKQKKEAFEKAALRKRLRDVAYGAGINGVDDECYWDVNLEVLKLLIGGLVDLFSGQTKIISSTNDNLLADYWHLPNYQSLDELTEWMYNLGYRA